MANAIDIYMQLASPIKYEHVCESKRGTPERPCTVRTHNKNVALVHKEATGHTITGLL